MKNVAAVILITALATGCVSPPSATRGTKFEMSDVDTMQPGVTTYDDAVAKLGKPRSQNYAADGSRTVMWVYVRVAGGNSESRATKMLFDKDGNLVRIMGKME